MIIGIAQHATATTRHDMKPSFLLVLSPTFFTHAAGRGVNALDRETMLTDGHNSSFNNANNWLLDTCECASVCE